MQNITLSIYMNVRKVQVKSINIKCRRVLEN